MKTLQDEGNARVYRALSYGERAVRRACPRCHDRHAALINWRMWVLQCRACGYVFERPFLFGSRERRRQSRRHTATPVMRDAAARTVGGGATVTVVPTLVSLRVPAGTGNGMAMPEELIAR